MFKVNNKDTKTTPTPCSSVSIVNFEHVNASWVISGTNKIPTHMSQSQ